MCQDLNKVSYKHSYSFAVFNEDEAKKLDRTLETLKSNVHEVICVSFRLEIVRQNLFVIFSFLLKTMA